MSIIFKDTFTGTDGTLLTAHTPDIGTSWATVGSDTSPEILSNRAHTHATGATDYVVAAPAPSSHNYDVEHDIVINSVGSTDTTGTEIRSHSSASADNYGYYLFVRIASSVVKVVNGFVVPAGNTQWANIATGLGAGATCHGRISTTYAAGTLTLNFYLTRASDGFYLKSDGTWQAGQVAFDTRTDSSPIASGTAALRFYDYVTGGVGFDSDNFTVTDTSGSLSGTMAVVSTAAGNHCYLDGTHGSTAPSGGTAPYSYQWYKSTTANFTPGAGNIVSGATANTYNDTAAAESVGTFYACIVTDSVPNSATAGPLGGCRTRADLAVGFIGDSIYYNTPPSGDQPPTTFANLLQYSSNHAYGVTVGNFGASGSSTASWLPTASVWGGVPSTGGLRLFDWAVNGLNAINAQTVILRLGVNDALAAVSAATFGANLATIISHLFSSVGTLQRVILNYQYFTVGSYGGTVAALSQTYQAQIDAQVNGTTVFSGDKRLWDYTSGPNGAAFRNDDVHPTKAGAQLIAQEDVDSILGVLYPAGSGSLSRVFTGL